MKYCLVIDNQIKKYNVDKPKVIIGEQEGIYLPIVDIKPEYDSNTQRISSKTYEIQEDHILAVYTLEVIPEEEITKAKIANIENAVQNLLDMQARSLGYDSINTIGKYLIVGNPFYEECTKLSLWTGNIWSSCYTILAQVQNGEIQEPTLEELLSMLPTFE